MATKEWYADNKERMRAHRKAWYERNREKQKAIVVERKKLIGAWLEDLKSKLACIKCGESHVAVLDFHHRNPEEKEIDVAQAVYCRGWSKERILEEIEKCDVL